MNVSLASVGLLSPLPPFPGALGFLEDGGAVGRRTLWMKGAQREREREDAEAVIVARGCSKT
jgi:hypothetical protein